MYANVIFGKSIIYPIEFCHVLPETFNSSDPQSALATISPGIFLHNDSQWSESLPEDHKAAIHWRVSMHGRGVLTLGPSLVGWSTKATHVVMLMLWYADIWVLMYFSQYILLHHAFHVQLLPPNYQVYLTKNTAWSTCPARLLLFFLFLSLSHSAPELLSKHDVPRGWSDQASDPKWNASTEMFDPIYTWWLHVNVTADCSTTSKPLTSPQNFWNKIFTKLLHDLGRMSYSMILDPFLCALFVLTIKTPMEICQTIYLQRGTTPSRSRPRYCAVALPRQTNMISVSILLQSHCHSSTFWPLETTKLWI